MENQKYSNIKTALDEMPNRFDLAIVSISQYGDPGILNTHVLSSLDYNISVLDSINLDKGFYLLKGNLVPVLLIVTVGNEYTGILLKKNLTNAIKKYYKDFVGKTAWIPLMGTGAGGLEFVSSYDTTAGVLRQFKDINFTISVPNESRGVKFLKAFKTYNLEPLLEENSKTKEETLDFGNKLKGVNYFLAGHIWKGKDQLPRFIDNKIWENGHDKNDTNAVNTVKKNDIVFIKTTYVHEKISYLRIKAVGLVVSNKNDGHNLDVNWHVFENHINIEQLGKYRRTFQRVMPDDRYTLLEEVLTAYPNLIDLIADLSVKKNSSEELKKSIKEQSKKEVKRIITIAGLLSDTDSGTDYLDISKDINAFAKVMSAKSFSPPLAIALLGKWGSGKSFFMRKLKERIKNLSKNENQNAYCNGIAHVHFNAWSYMDSNLWAGIITKIFEGLQEYISNDSIASIQKMKIEKTLTEKLNISRDEITNLQHQEKSIDSRIKELESQKGEAEAGLDKKIEEIKSKSIKTALNNLDKSFKITEKVSDVLSKNDSFNKSKEKFSEIIPEAYWQNPTELYKKIKSKYTFLKTFFKGPDWKKSLLWFFLILVFILSMKNIVLFIANILGKADFNFPDKIWYYVTIGGTFVYRTYKTSKCLQPLISSFWKIKEDYELQKKDIIFKVNQAEKALKFEIENYKTEIVRINTQITQAKQTKLEIEYRLENTLTTEALFNFIEKRSISDDYKKHLGIVSVIRKDFEILSELFSGHRDELSNSDESQEFRRYFNRPLERIILYIDDLDRCSDDRVVQVLEAVNLLMAYPLFVVVVGVDPRWVKNALTKKYNLQFDNENDLQDFETIEPSGYLEKIFQVPFQLKSATSKSVKHMLKTLAESQPETEIIDNNLVYDEDGEISGYFNQEEEKEEDYFASQGSITQEVVRKETIESLKFSEREIELLQSMSNILGSNPRSLKRFVNIYRVIKVHEDFNYINESEDGEYLVVMFLIALPLGKYKKLVKPFDKWLEVVKNNNVDLYSFLKDAREGLKYELKQDINDNESILLYQKINIFQKHSSFIKRFTFNNL